MFWRPFYILAVWSALALTAGAQPQDPLDQLLAEHPSTTEAPAVPQWLNVTLTAPSPPVIGEPFAVAAHFDAPLAALPDATYRWELPKGVRVVEGKPEGSIPLEVGKPASLTWKLTCNTPLSIVEGQLSLEVRARLPKKALFEETRKLPAAQAASVEAEIRKSGEAAQPVFARLEVAVSSREGFLGFSPLVWGAYLGENGFYVGAGSFMDTNFSAQDLVADAEKQLLAGKPREALALLERARVDLRPGAEADSLLRWEAANCEAVSLFATGERKRAKEIWQRTLADPAFAETRRYCLYNLGEASRQDGEPTQAKRWFAEAGQEKPSFRLPLAKLVALGK